MQSYLIPYVDPKKNDGHEDPNFEEFSYGDNGERGSWLRNKVEKGDFLFFHTKIRGKTCVTAYYYVERSMATEVAQRDNLIMKKYKNPHLTRENLEKNETIIFGNPVYSKVLKQPFPIDNAVLTQLSGTPKSISRPWVKLSNEDVEFLLDKIEEFEKDFYLKDTYLTTEEIGELREKDIEDFLFNNPNYIEEGLECFGRQLTLKSGKRIDLLFKHSGSDKLTLVEVKNGTIGRDVYYQLKGYIDELEKMLKKPIQGVIVCRGIIPISEMFFQEKMQKEDIVIYYHAWKFSLVQYKK
jgi:hypothetical protein